MLPVGAIANGEGCTNSGIRHGSNVNASPCGFAVPTAAPRAVCDPSGWRCPYSTLLDRFTAGFFPGWRVPFLFSFCRHLGGSSSLYSIHADGAESPFGGAFHDYAVNGVVDHRVANNGVIRGSGTPVCHAAFLRHCSAWGVSGVVAAVHGAGQLLRVGLRNCAGGYLCVLAGSD